MSRLNRLSRRRSKRSMRGNVSGIPEVIAEIQRRVNDLGTFSQKGLLRAGQYLDKESAKQCPVVTGALVNRRIGVRLRKQGVFGNRYYVAVGYTVVYATRVHENPRSGRTAGVSPSGRRYKKWSKVGKWKFLEDPLKENVRLFVSLIAGEARRSLR
jgi:hypothetical protein